MIKKALILLLCIATFNTAQTIQVVASSDSSNHSHQLLKLFNDFKQVPMKTSLKHEPPIGSGDIKVIRYLALGGIAVGLLMIFAKDEGTKKAGPVVAGVSAIVYFLFGGD